MMQSHISQSINTAVADSTASAATRKIQAEYPKSGTNMNPVEVSQLKKSYGDIKAVDGISFTVNPGEVFGLWGPNGADWTTTIEILEGLRKKESGEKSR